MAVLLLVAPAPIAVAPLPVHPHYSVSTFMPFFLRKENERLSTFMHRTLWRQQLFMHMRVHFVIFVRTMLWVRDSVRAWCVHSPKQLRKLPGAVHFPTCAQQDFLWISAARRCDSSTKVVVKRHEWRPPPRFGCDNLQRSHMLCIYNLKTIRFFRRHTVRHRWGGVKYRLLPSYFCCLTSNHSHAAY
jgi:hypothetical protein